jgi:hypothetical protein
MIEYPTKLELNCSSRAAPYPAVEHIERTQRLLCMILPMQRIIAIYNVVYIMQSSNILEGASLDKVALGIPTLVICKRNEDLVYTRYVSQRPWQILESAREE